MFEFIRTHTRLVLGFMLLLIIPSFVFFGIDGYSRSVGGANTTVAKVAGLTITRAEWEYAHQRAIDRVRRQNPEQADKILDTPAARRRGLVGRNDPARSAEATDPRRGEAGGWLAGGG